MRILTVVMALAAPVAAQAGFRAGDLFLYAPSTTTAGGYMLQQIDAGTGVIQPLILLDSVPIAQSLDGACYDPARNRILVSAGIGGSTPELWAVDASGSAQSLGSSGVWINKMAPRGDGVVYCVTVPGSLTEILYLDGSNAIQPLMDASGAAPFVSPRFTRMIYHPGENALYLAENTWFTGACSPGTWTGDIVNVHKVPLSPNGTRVAGPAQCTTLDISDSAQAATGWSLLPGGDLLLVIDTNTNNLEPRMQRLDPVTLAATDFAANGPYIGAASVPAGIWSSAAGKAVLLDTSNNVLRAFGPGEAGAGAVLPPTAITNPSTNNGVVRMFEVGPVAITGRLTASTRELSLSAGGIYSMAFDPGSLAGTSYWILGSISGWNPGWNVLGTRVWVTPDFYTDYTIASANAGMLQNTAGLITPGSPSLASILVPSSLPAALAGFEVHHCGVALDGGLAPLWTTNPVSLRLVP